ncbi:MAG TPA: adenylate/guanylate cyclase domain-containing protein [Acidimicrobiales bacterium]|nr:adenylate/guanylate cyclase domain-containing protein [Acidimicrobiales bacterium]
MSESAYFAAEGGARVDRTFAFIDLSGFTAYTDSEGDAEAVQVLSGFRATVREIAAARVVRIAKWLGDGAMLVAVETEPGVEAVVEIERRIDESGSPLALRAGLASGPVLLFEGDDYIGQAVNLASRLCDLAHPHEVLAPASLISSLMVNTRAVPIGARHVSGFGQPIDLVRLVAPEGHA